jgi:o-succinylbenzoate synthase
VVDIEPFALGLSAPLATAHGTIREREGFLVRVEYAGRRGVGEATPLPGWTETYEECETALARAVEVAEELDWGVALTKTESPAARHGLALALADARANAADEPLYRGLGGEGEVRVVPVNATIGDGDADETVAAARAAVEEGFDCLKLKVGARSVAADIERVRAVSEETDARLRVDANGAWSLSEARKAMAALAEVGVDYVEQPLPADDLSGHADLNGPVDVALDESLAAYDIEQVLDAGAADVVVLKPMVLGGPDLAREAALRARDAGVEPVVSTTVDAVVARTGAVHLAASIPDIGACGLATGSMLRSDLAPDPAPVADGGITVPGEPGLGLPARP